MLQLRRSRVYLSEDGIEFHLVGLCHCCQWIERGENLVTLGLIHVEDQDRQDLISHRLDAEMTVEQHQRSVFHHPSQHSICDSDFGEHTLECVGLRLGVRPPVFRIRPQFRCRHSTKFNDSVADFHWPDFQ